MSNKNQEVIEKGIDHSVSLQRGILVVPPGARGQESMHPAHVAQPPQQTQVVTDDRGVKTLDITGLIRRKEEKKLKELKELKEHGELAGRAKTHYPTPKGGRKSRRSSHKHGRRHSKKQKCVHHTRRKRTRRHRHSRHRRR